MENQVEEIVREKLFDLQDLKYKEFTSKLIPSKDEGVIIGVRMPALRKLAKELVKSDIGEKYLEILPHKYMEEYNLHGLLLENNKDIDFVIEKIDLFLPYVDNWATCDLISPKAFKKYPDKVYEKIKIWIESNHVYTVRFAIQIMLSNYLDDNFKPEMLELVTNIDTEEYYINMVIAWYLSFALIKQYDATIGIIESKELGKFVHNKTIQKAIESRQIDEDTKKYLKTLKK
ncbi:DNA alkylation repair protein [Peptostreptococcus faecalis]|uniref:DNA alkylation repair protein n=1 Tax=Peptostreptococcus faecalis TaxID=2045015 RepID=UPI000C7C1BC7|nr:DNA alkylation repair protein [Peptostreptococcus faecalis]